MNRHNQVPRSLVDFAVKIYRESGETERFKLAWLRQRHIRCAWLYGYDHPTTVRYRDQMHRQWNKVLGI